jgi:23S rRNA (guanosine2251-2'-O)-methyltransferase
LTDTPKRKRPFKDAAPLKPQKPNRRPGGSSRPKPAEKSEIQPHLFGHHAVAAAIANPARSISRICATENAARKLEEAWAERTDLPAIEKVTAKDLDYRLGADTVHQGVYAEIAPLAEPELADVIASAADTGPIVVLDQVTDPHNVGAVLRSAAVFGAAAVVMTRRHSPPLFGTLAKSASGALELVPIVLVQNLGRALEEMGAAGVRRLGMDGEAETTLASEPLTGATALVLGAEGKGLRASTKELCDQLIGIGATGPIASLNVSNAAAIALHFASLKRTGAI